MQQEQVLGPKLRFSEFSDDWIQFKMKDIFDISAGGDIKKIHVSKTKTERFKYPIFANSEKDKGLYGYSDIFKIDGKTLTIAGRGVNVGIAHARNERYYPIVRLLVLKPKHESINKFYEYQFNRKNILIESTGVPQLTAPQVSTYKIFIPSLQEQQKIAAFLSAVDTKIQQLERKKELLEQYKKGIMQQLFNQDLRFKQDDGSNYPDWEEKRLKDVLIHKSVRNKELKYNLVLSVSNTKGFISQSEQFDGHRVASKDVSNYKIVKRNQFAYNPSRINVGSIAKLKDYEIGIVSPMYVIFEVKKEFDTRYIEFLTQIHLFKHFVKVGCSGSVRDSLNYDDLESFKFSFPTKEEQTKIANFLSAIDSKIELVNTQITQNQIFKKGLLQQMFV